VTEADGDCDDHNGWAHPGATEVLDGIDNDCDGQVDEEGGEDTDACPDGSAPTSGCGGSQKCPGDGACSTAGGADDKVGLLVAVLVGASLRRRRRRAA
jgi:MYXO-CTERM domain-containing protein